LRTAIEWSYAALPEPERQLLQALSIFASGAPLDAIEAVAPLPGGGCLPALAALVDTSLVVRAGAQQQPRYRLLETIREHAAERLHEAIDLASLAPDGPARWGWASRPVVITSATLSLAAKLVNFRLPRGDRYSFAAHSL
jgi:predicted ATPase